jgi:SAM-dependent methyltransferase
MSVITKQAAFAILRGYLNYPEMGVFHPIHYIHQYAQSADDRTLKVLDLGCGAGHSIDIFRRILPRAEWHGVDIDDSPEVRDRTRTDGAFATFDGIHLPYPGDEFDFIFSNQVLEHVRHPEQLLKDVARVLKPNGCFAGALSYLEPYHSFSIFNFTPYGVATVLQHAGFHLVDLRPGPDALSMIFRQLLGNPSWSRHMLNHSPFYWLIERIAQMRRFDATERNYAKLQFCGHICFKALGKDCGP